MLGKTGKDESMTVIITSNAEQVSLLAEGIHAMCVLVTGNEKWAMELQAAIVEALNNVVSHAYRGEAGHEINLRLTRKDRQMRIEIIDYGLSMPSLPEPHLPDFSSENGRGWWIINACVDEYHYDVIEPADQDRLISDPATASEIPPRSHCNILTLLKNF